MNKAIPYLLLIILIPSLSFSQNLQKIAKEIKAEGQMLYELEVAAWSGTDYLLNKYKELRTLAGGYFAYLEGDQSVFIFYNHDNPPKVIASVTFNDAYEFDIADESFKKRDFTKKEEALYEIRHKTKVLTSNDTFFKKYEMTNYNLIPVIKDRKKMVYILTATTQDSVVLFGNDYLVKFNRRNKVKEKIALHRNLIPVEIGIEGQLKDEETGEPIGAIHSHVPPTSPYMTATDVCTCMLYCDYAGWEQHIVVSEKHLSIWSCKDNNLLILPMDFFDKIDENKIEPGD